MMFIYECKKCGDVESSEKLLACEECGSDVRLRRISGISVGCVPLSLDENLEPFLCTDRYDHLEE